MKKITYLYADFETTSVKLPKQYKNYKEYYDLEKNTKKPKIYSWCVLHTNVEKNVSTHKEYNYRNTKYYYDISGNSFINFIENIKVDSIMYFNNLKGFDGHFIIPLLDKNNYINVLPFEIEKLTKLPSELQISYYKRIFRLKNEILKTKKIRDQYNKYNLLSNSTANNYLSKFLKKRWNNLLPNEYSILTNKNNHIFQIKIGLKDLKRTNGIKRNRAIIIRDNLLLFPSSIKNMGETILKHYANEFNLKDKKSKEYLQLENLYLKKELDSGYNKTELYKNKQELENDGNELDYLRQDSYILFKFHELIEKSFPRNQWKMTIGSTAYKSWTDILGTSLCDNAINEGLAEEIFLKRGAKRIIYNNKHFDTMSFKKHLINKILPTKWLNSKTENNNKIWDDIYKYYGGGISHVNENYRGQLMENVTVLDINSSYPSQQVKNVNVPFGRAFLGDSKNHPFKFFKLIPNKKIINKYGLPFLHNSLESKREYTKTLLPNRIYYFTSISYENFKKYYSNNKNDYELIIEYSFKQISINKIYADFVNHWYKIKQLASENNDIILKMISKLFLNSLYGKFGTKILRDSKYWDQNNNIWESYTEDTTAKYYLPLAVCITELARNSLVEAVDTNYNDFIYCDTDSIFVKDFNITNYKNIHLHDSKLGDWDIEYTGGYGIVRRSKQYLFLSDNHKKPKIAFAGINFNRLQLPDNELKELSQYEKEFRKLSLMDFVLGKTIPNQLSPYRLLGSGIVFENIEKTIKPIWDYKESTILKEQIYFKKEHFIKTIKKISKISKISI